MAGEDQSAPGTYGMTAWFDYVFYVEAASAP